MVQQIITYIIIAAAVGYTLRGFYKVLLNAYREKNGSVCSGCASCDMKRELSGRLTEKH